MDVASRRTANFVADSNCATASSLLKALHLATFVLSVQTIDALEYEIIDDTECSRTQLMNVSSDFVGKNHSHFRKKLINKILKSDQ